MNLRAEKMEMIHQLMHIDDKKILEQVKSILNKAPISKMQPMSLEEFYKQIEESENDIKNGNVYTTEQLKHNLNIK